MSLIFLKDEETETNFSNLKKLGADVLNYKWKTSEFYFFLNISEIQSKSTRSEGKLSAIFIGLKPNHLKE